MGTAVGALRACGSALSRNPAGLPQVIAGIVFAVHAKHQIRRESHRQSDGNMASRSVPAGDVALGRDTVVLDPRREVPGDIGVGQMSNGIDSPSPGDSHDLHG